MARRLLRAMLLPGMDRPINKAISIREACRAGERKMFMKVTRKGMGVISDDVSISIVEPLASKDPPPAW